MGIIAIIKQALRIARTHKSLWLFGFLAGVGIGFNGGGGGGGGQPGGGAPIPTPAEPAAVAAVIAAGLVVVIALIVLKFISAAALIEGVKRALANGTMTVREGFREGWANWGVLLRIGIVFGLVGFASVGLLAGVGFLGVQVFGRPVLVLAVALAALVGIPWLVTLGMWQAYAERIAVLEDRRALDAIRKARLFLHGRLGPSLKLFVAAFVGVVFVGAVGAAVIAPFVLLLRAFALGLIPSVAIGLLTVLPLAVFLISLIGIVTSSVWTIGYIKQVEP